MAHMIPPAPKEFDPKSEEGIVFDALKKLPDDYYVFHSMKPTVVNDDTLYEREIDFVVANAKKGVLCIEAKNGANISYSGREWKYSNGTPMRHGGPYNQIATAKRTIIDEIKYHKNKDVRALFSKCKIMHAVWFFRVSTVDFEKIVKNSGPEDGDERITLLAEDLLNPTRKIADILSLKIPAQTRQSVDENKLMDEEFQLLLDAVLCPTFNLIPSPVADNVLLEDRMNQLLHEQYRLLDFLTEQRFAVINGAAGTGKTMLAVEKARRHSLDGDRVLFLCYNRMLCDHLNNKYKNTENKTLKKQYKNIDFMTLSKYTKEVTGNHKDFDGLQRYIEDCYGDIEKFGYNHVIIDEGQDFGLVDAKKDKDEGVASRNCSIIDSIQDVVTDAGGTFYLFYDKYQMIQGGGNIEYEIPSCIIDSDCRLSLYCNCRNTKEIALTSITPLRDKRRKAVKPTVACSWVEPRKPTMNLCNTLEAEISAVDMILDEYAQDGLKNIVILTMGTVDYCCISEYLITDGEKSSGYCSYEHNGIQVPVTTCIKFKGLEADAIIVLGINKDSFIDEKGMEFYVGTSRAKLRLDMVCRIEPDEYYEVVHAIDENAPNKNNEERMRRILGNVFSADVRVIDL